MDSDAKKAQTSAGTAKPTDLASEDRLRELFPAPVAVSTVTGIGHIAPLFEAEEAAIRGAADQRRREFTAGRAAARAALQMLGHPPVPIPRRADRTPEWPDGIVGSISHCEGFVCAVVGLRPLVGGVGIDVEAAGPLPAGLEKMVCRPSEIARLADMPPVAGADWGKVVFGAKEAFYKCFYPRWRKFLEFHDVEMSFTLGESRAEGRFEGRLVKPALPEQADVPTLLGRWLVDGERIYSAVTLPPDRLDGEQSPAGGRKG